MNLPAEMAFVKLVSLGYNWNGTEWVITEDNEEQGWILWNGGDCPVEKGTPVDVRYRSGEIQYDQQALCFSGAMATYWMNYGLDEDIVAYRLSN
jgi:hypothetical protein